MSGIALLLSALVVAIGGVGLYALMSYEVVQRTHELGVRLTLGATSGSVVILVLTDAFKLVMPALAIGIPLGIIGSGSLAPQLYGVQTTDPWTITSVGLLMTGLALAATITPAQNASRIDPVALLRSD